MPKWEIGPGPDYRPNLSVVTFNLIEMLFGRTHDPLNTKLYIRTSNAPSSTIRITPIGVAIGWGQVHGGRLK